MNNEAYTALPTFLYPSASKIAGTGIFTHMVIKPEQLLGVGHFDLNKVSLTEEEYKVFKHIPQGFLRSPLIGFMNHADEPNCEIVEIGRFTVVKTIKRINVNGELTLDYRKGKGGVHYLHKILP